MSKEYERIRAEVKKQYNKKLADMSNRIIYLENAYMKEYKRRIELQQENIKLKVELNKEFTAPLSLFDIVNYIK